MLMAKATGCFKRKDYATAVEYLDTILVSDPKNQFAISKIIQCFSRMRRIDYAEEEYRGALKHGVANIFIHNSMLDAYAKAGKLKEAENIYYNKLGDKANTVSHNSMLDAYAKAGKLKEAESVYIQLGSQANTVSHRAMAYGYYNNSRYDEALDFIETLPVDARDSLPLQLVRFDVLRKMGRRDEALVGLNALLLRLPVDYSNADYVLARTLRAYVLKDTGQSDLAHASFRQLYSSVSSQSEHYARIICGLVFSSDTRSLSSSEQTEIQSYLKNLLESNNLNEGLKFDTVTALRKLGKSKD